MPKFDSQNPAQTPSVVIGRALHFIGRKVRVWPEEEATAEEAYRYAIRHDILGRQDLSQAAGAAAEHERADAREPERGRVEPRVVRFTKHDDDTCERMSTLRRGRKAPPRRRLTRVDSPNVRAGGDIASFPMDCPVKIARRSRTAARGARKSRAPPSFFPRDSVAASAHRREPCRLHRDDDPSLIRVPLHADPIQHPSHHPCRRHLYNSVRLDRRWGPLGVVPIKLAVLLPAAVLDLGGLLSNKTGTTPMEASVAACAMSVLVAIMASFIFFPNAASHYLRRSARGGGYVSWMVHPRVGEVTLWACILATEIGFSRLASQAVTGTSGVQTRLGSSLIELGGQETSPADSTREFTTMGSTSTLPALLFPLLNWVAVGFLSPLMSCELYCVGVGVDPADSLVGGFGCSAWIHALSRIGTATWLCVGLTRGDSLLSPADAGVIRSLAWMSVVKVRFSFYFPCG